MPVNSQYWSGLCDWLWPMGHEGMCFIPVFFSLTHQVRKWAFSDGAVVGQWRPHQPVLLNHHTSIS